ncbi:MAG: NAD-dependent deacylase [Leptospiraceae bacterium]|nr:NAD-dependent deacylase [Leptospiraceae bacterium]MDW7976137.1 NAD-dependent deacylase [Leptospiraceae bacterium]
MSDLDSAIEQVLQKIPKNIKRLGVLTGAGISNESGIPTFRGNDGLWKNYRPEELATPEAFRKNPVLVWEWYEMRRQIIKNAKPNLAHITLVEMEEFFEEFLLVTQNVDGLHEKAGSKNVVEIHGNIWKARCTFCGHKEFLDTPLNEIPPKCTKCSSLMRPDVLWFGEMYDIKILNSIQEFFDGADIIFIIGSSGQVYVPVYIAKQAQMKGAFILEINPERSYYSEFAEVVLNFKSAEALPKLWKSFKSQLQKIQ